MMRTTVAILALAPAFAFAQTQTKTPAQPASTPVLQAALLKPVAFTDLKSTDNASARTSSVRVSTGVVAPELVHSVGLSVGQTRTHVLAANRTVVLELVVDAAGTPTGVHVVKSVDPILDEKAVIAVEQFRYKPGTLNGQPAAVPVRLEFNILQGASY
jgi:TonB family protein